VAVEEGAIGDGDVLHRAIAAGLERDIVIAGVREDVADEDVVAGAGIDGVGIGGIGRGVDFNAVDEDIVAVLRDEVKIGGIPEGDATYQEAGAAFDDDEVWTRDIEGAGDAGGAVGLCPPWRAGAIDDALPADGEVCDVRGADEGTEEAVVPVEFALGGGEGSGRPESENLPVAWMVAPFRMTRAMWLPR